MLFLLFLQEGSQVSSSLAALQAERDVLLRSARERDAELSSLRQQAQQQHGFLDMERDRLNRELEALRAQLQQQVQAGDAGSFWSYKSSSSQMWVFPQLVKRCCTHKLPLPFYSSQLMLSRNWRSTGWDESWIQHEQNWHLQTTPCRAKKW